MSPNIYARSTHHSIDAAIEGVTNALAKRQFGVLWQLDLNQKLVEKGLAPEPPFHILEVCSAPRAKEALAISQAVGYFLPCKIVVYQDHESGQTMVGFPEPEVLMALADTPELSDLAHTVAKALRESVDEAVQ
jgi:uncharacterized protein (DUF302 family)